MTIAYPLAKQLDYTELKYSLRSIEKFIVQPFEVLIIGDNIPDWLTNVTQIELPDIKGRKQLSIRRKILAALEYSEEILFMNDDIFILESAKTFPYYYHGSLVRYAEAGTKPLVKELQAIDKNLKHFDGHYPLIYERDKFKEASEHFTDDCIIKSLYCNYCNIEGVLAPDCKLLRATKPEYVSEFIKDRPSFSTGVFSLPGALPILQKLYPNKSIFEL